MNDTPLKVLHLEDSPLDARLIAAAIEGSELRCDITRVESREGFDAAIDANCWDIILADYSLPSFDGQTALEIVLERCPDTPFIFVSGVLGEERAVEALKRGATDYVLKQGLHRLGQSIRRALREVRERRERQAAEQALRHAKEAAEAASRAKDEFLAVVSHELRTPLTPLLGWIRLLRTASPDPATLHRGLEVMERNIRAQVRLIDDLLDISRIITGKLRLEVQRVDVLQSLQAALEIVRPSAQARDITLRCDLPTDVIEVNGDPPRLQQVFWNLLSNAVKFTPKGGRISVSLEQRDGQVRLTISDSGEGIEPAFLPLIFNRFSQEGEGAARAHGGMGLGLAIARHLVEGHGGVISASSEGKGKGSSFVIELPLAARLDPLGTTLPARGAAPASSLPLRGVKVLLVEDEPDIRGLLALVLERAGAVVLQTGSTTGAIQQYVLERPHVLVSDIGLPGMDGYDLLGVLRERAAGAPLPAIALTAYTSDAAQQRAIDAGYQLHMAKPVEPDELIAAVAGLLADRTSIR